MVPFVVLIILDGWGVSPILENNAISRANLPNYNSYISTYPHTTLLASGEAVGLPKYEVGNTETGHLNIGAGRIIYQDFERINRSILNKDFFSNKTFLDATAHVLKNKSNLHLMGLVGHGAVHSSLNHLFALLTLAKEQNIKNVYLHLFTDGRDSPPNSAKDYLVKIEDHIKKLGIGKIASIMGRYWALDRDQNWDRTKKAYLALTHGEAKIVSDIYLEIESLYNENITDEFIEPTLLKIDEKIIQIKDNDAVIFFNFRIDRPRQLTRFFVSDFDNNKNIFDRDQKLNNLFFATMTQYDKDLINDTHIAFTPVSINLPLSAAISSHGYLQYKLSESEKERFVTYYFNGFRELPFDGEERLIVKSPLVATYDLQPEMSAPEITKNFLKILDRENPGKFKLMCINFANADMVGHTGNFDATVKACEAIDRELGLIVDRTKLLGGTIIITADHGNAEAMTGAKGDINTEHTANSVPFIIISEKLLERSNLLQSGILADIAPTILKLLEISKPSEMTGKSLI